MSDRVKKMTLLILFLGLLITTVSASYLRFFILEDYTKVYEEYE